ncbi:DUF5011 domain-containing protein [Enterococcus sp. BWT-B8]|uniref:immunoglobulin-like domain-containing protein n=1 Tax=Enterococcus sp. BWT-B8 TaxID=2885157 RepID=UPI001E3684A5|nr:immunoglobulin-like domain-containing protein [Enterococcus sp. BWT-B8]MCB5950897.1 DUF5011 domain-containing protein [Enterococcus sp. BWT-B8]
MKSKKMVKLTLVTLLAPTLLNAQVALADSVEQTADSTATAVSETVVPAAEEITPAAPVAEAPVVEEEAVVEEPAAEEAAPSNELPSVELPSAELPPVELPGATPAEPEVPGTTPDVDITHIPPVPSEADAPIISVVPIKTIRLGKAFNPLEGVYAFDNVDGNISSKIVVTSNNVNINVENETPYTVTYSVENSAGKVTTATTDVYVVDDSYYGMLDVSISDFTVAQNGDFITEIKNRIVVKNPDGSITDPSEYHLYTSGSAGGGDVGDYQLSVVVESLKYGTFAETTVNIKVIKGISLEASDRTVFLGDTFNPLEGVTANEIKADGSTVTLGAYDGASDKGIAVYGTVDTTTPGDYPITYSAKTASGVVERKTVTITVAASIVTITAEDVTIMQGEAFDPLAYASATDEKDGTLAVTVTANDVDASTTGTYNVTYAATNSYGTTETKTITVNVVERTATITAADQEVFEGQEVTSDMILGWATVTDPVDTDLAVSYTVVEGDIDTSVIGAVYTVDYSVTNSAGNTTTAQISVTVIEREVTIEAADQTVEIGTAVTDEMILSWATASDSVDGTGLAVTDFTVLDGPIDTTVPGTFTIEYSFTNSIENTVTKTITLNVVDSIEPTISVEDKVMYVGDKLTEDMILEWAVAENAEAVGFEIAGDPIMVKASDSTLVEAGVHTIRFYALRGEKMAETTMTLTVKDKEVVTPADPAPDAGNEQKAVKTEAIKSSEKELPKTGVKESSFMSAISGMIMVAGAYFLKKKKDKENNLDLF